MRLREVEEVLLDPGIAVSYQTVHRWCRKHALNKRRRTRRKVAELVSGTSMKS
ncbi:hypothetical protein NKJ74_31470 [Mesorhizobium sp. M0046]|uniref:hypothetical protein n=1 Tax=Mesorhizobium sp. M0046 TaxID=2956858 RepID=UPI0033384B4F